MKFDQEMIPVGTFFKRGEEVHYVSAIEGSVCDENGKRHPIAECMISTWTELELNTAKDEAAKLKKIFNDSIAQLDRAPSF